jgi:glycosyltransferase involved in cell wall biosynthesis
MRLLILSRYGYAGPSSRVRMFQYLPVLERAGIEVCASALLDDDYVRRLYRGGGRRWDSIARQYLRRVRDIAGAHRYDLVWLEKECWPWVPAVLDPGLLARKAAYVVDYDDAVFHNYDEADSRLARAVYGRKIDAVMHRARLVTAGNGYLAARARTAGAPWIELLPSVIDLDRYCRAPGNVRGSGLTVGWIGSPATQSFLEPLIPVFERTLDPLTDRLVTIGANFPQPCLPNHEAKKWTEASEAQDIACFDVGIMPVPDRPFERGKCGFKLIQYMAAGLPVVASAVGVNTELVEDGVNGFLATTDAQWQQALTTLRRDPQLRARMGAAGRARVEAAYCLQVTGPRLVSLLQRAAQHGRSAGAADRLMEK